MNEAQNMVERGGLVNSSIAWKTINLVDGDIGDEKLIIQLTPPQIYRKLYGYLYYHGGGTINFLADLKFRTNRKEELSLPFNYSDGLTTPEAVNVCAAATAAFSADCRMVVYDDLGIQRFLSPSLVVSSASELRLAIQKNAQSVNGLRLTIGIESSTYKP